MGVADNHQCKGARTADNRWKGDNGWKGKETSGTGMTATTRRRPVPFQYPALSKVEIGICYSVVACSMIYAWCQVIIASNEYQFQYWHEVQINRLPLIGERIMVGNQIWMSLNFK